MKARSSGAVSGCKARQYSDQMQCDRCGLAWDVNDIDPPSCLPQGRCVASFRGEEFVVMHQGSPVYGPGCSGLPTAADLGREKLRQIKESLCDH